MIELDIFEFSQPGGIFYMGKMPVKEILSIYRITSRKYNEDKIIDNDIVQRESSPIKIKQIREYSLGPDASFPTPIILALNSKSVELENSHLTFKEENQVADIIDGQHRLLGLDEAYQINPDKVGEIELPIIFIFDATSEQKALIFATINGKQTKVSSSLVADLYGVTTGRNPRKTAHEIARSLNSDKESPWFGRLKMLGKRTSKEKLESLSQGTFVRELLPKISSDPDDDFRYAKRKMPFKERPDSIFNQYFIADEDEVTLKILKNIFQSVKETWPNEWNNPDDFILTKTAGYEAIMGALDNIVIHGRENKDLSKDFFNKYLGEVKEVLESEEIHLTSEYFKSQRGDVKKLTSFFLKPLDTENGC